MAESDEEIATGSTEEISMSQSSELCDEELDQLVQEAEPESTKVAGEWGFRKLTEWLTRRKMVVNFHTIEPSSLAVILRKFYGEVKTKKRTSPSVSTLVSIRFVFLGCIACFHSKF